MSLQLNTTADGLVYPAGSSTFDGVFPDGFKAMMDSVGSALTKSRWLRPSLTGDVPTNSLNESGLHPVTSSATAQTLGLPSATMGFLEVLYANDSYSKQTWIPMGGGTAWSRVCNSGTWSAWRPISGTRGTIPANTDMDLVRGSEWAGDWDMPLAPTTNTLTGTLPTGQETWLPGQFRVMGWAGGTTNLSSQLYLPYQDNGVWYRTISNYSQTGAPAWTPWVNLAGDPGALIGAAPNAMLVQDFTRRRGPVRTNGKGAVALRFDHGLANFRDKILPLLRARGLKASLALNSRAWGLAENGGVSAADVDGWVTEGVVEVWNHGAHHADAVTSAELEDTIVTGLAELSSQIPSAQIDGWVVPGVGGTNYNGFNGGGSLDAFTSTEAGRLILANHAVSTGAISGTAHRVLDGTVRQGMGHYTLDAVTGTAAQYQIDLAATNVTGIQLMLHPSVVDEPDKVTTAKLTEVLDYIVAKRDAGEIVVLSPYQLMLADAQSITPADLADTYVALNDPRVPGTTEADYAHAFTDAGGRVALGVRGDGSVEVQGSSLAAIPDNSGYSHAFGDSEGRIALGVRADGTVEAGGTPVAVQATLKETAWALTVSGGGGALGEDKRASLSARIPVASGARFRVKAIHLRNYNDRSGLAYSGALAMTGIWWGTHAQDTSGALTGNFKTAPTRLAGPLTTPADGAEVVISTDFWVEPGVEYLFSYGYDKDGTANHLGIGGCWTTDAATDAGEQTVTGTKSKFAPLDIWFEIETEARVIAWAGDSLSCGVSSDLPVYRSVPMVHGRANGYIPQMYTHSGSLMTSWTNSSAWKYQKWAGLDKADALVFSLGKNDFLNTTDPEVLRTRFASVYPILTGYTTGNMYLTTVLPSKDDSTTAVGVARRAWNDILRNEMLGNARMVFDFSAVVADPSTGNLRPEVDSGDGVHLNARGYMELARSITQPL